jgi:hypothetical protein
MCARACVCVCVRVRVCVCVDVREFDRRCDTHTDEKVKAIEEKATRRPAIEVRAHVVVEDAVEAHATEWNVVSHGRKVRTPSASRSQKENSECE